MAEPFFTHDCPACQYLGSTRDPRGVYDWYACTQTACAESVVARFGDDGPAYWSMARAMAQDDRYLRAAHQDGKTSLDGMMLLARAMLLRSPSGE